MTTETLSASDFDPRIQFVKPDGTIQLVARDWSSGQVARAQEWQAILEAGRPVTFYHITLPPRVRGFHDQDFRATPRGDVYMLTRRPKAVRKIIWERKLENRWHLPDDWPLVEIETMPPLENLGKVRLVSAGIDVGVLRPFGPEYVIGYKLFYRHPTRPRDRGEGINLGTTAQEAHANLCDLVPAVMLHCSKFYDESVIERRGLRIVDYNVVSI